MPLTAESKNALWKLARLVLFAIPVLAAMIAATFAFPLALLEGWSYADCFWTLMAEVCGVKGILIAPKLHPEGFFGKLLGCLIGLVSVVVLASAAGTIAKPLLKPIAVNLGFGVPDFGADLVEEVEEDHTSSASPPAGTGVDSGKPVSIEWICRVLVTRREILRATFNTAGAVENGGLDSAALTAALETVGIVNLAPTDVARLFARLDADHDGTITFEEIVRCCAEVAEGHRHTTQFLSALGKLALLVLVVVPVVVGLVSAAFAGVLAAVEGWTYETCFWLVLADLTHTNLAVVDHNTFADNTGGKLIACFVGIFSLSVFIFAIGVVGGPLMDPVTESLGFKPMQQHRGAALARHRAELVVSLLLQPAASSISSTKFPHLLLNIGRGDHCRSANRRRSIRRALVAPPCTSATSRRARTPTSRTRRYSRCCCKARLARQVAETRSNLPIRAADASPKVLNDRQVPTAGALCDRPGAARGACKELGAGDFRE